ncbi:MAG: hypothetical protein AVDCRST_MAG95-3343 [uncultured Adhaeribacter sp.]|uniref:Uncharacterized protein n=1 Tax=uncultured Adhaeribacter sp. TaxID=448109 RepID=A0A6J4JLA2_9BACT|nr:MAG: hypothetical protein AVDCRST_MAG95-3343 [uncultured Adhaeribacter sp.]
MPICRCKDNKYKYKSKPETDKFKSSELGYVRRLIRANL